MEKNADDILAQLDRVVTSSTFRQAKRLCALLEFSVKETLAGRTDSLTAPTIALEIFSQGKGLDARSEALVRVQARQLRMKLSTYYDTEGKNDPVRISVPSGGYKSAFEHMTSGAAAEARSITPGRVSLAIMSQPAAHGDPADVQMLDTLLRDVATRLSRFRTFAVRRIGARASEGEKGCPETDANVTLSGHMVHEDDDIVLSVELACGYHGDILWSRHFRWDGSGGSDQDWLRDVGRRIAVAIGCQTGPMPATLLNRWDRYGSPVDTTTMALLQFDRYLALPSADKHLELRSIFEEITADPNCDPVALGPLARLTFDESEFRFNPLLDAAPAQDRALKLAQTAVHRDPASSDCWCILSAIHHVRGDFDRSRAAETRAIELNPDNTDAMALIGLHKWSRGELEEGLALVETAVDLNETPPPWYHLTFVHEAIRVGDFAAARNHIVKIEMDGFFWLTFLEAVIDAQLGGSAEESRGIPRLTRDAPWFVAEIEHHAQDWTFPDAFKTNVIRAVRDGIAPAVAS